MQENPYFCPNCRSNRIKFNVISNFSRSILKDAVSGAVVEESEAQQMAQSEPEIQCRVCGFIGNEMRFVRQAEREPRMDNPVSASYT